VRRIDAAGQAVHPRVPVALWFVQALAAGGSPGRPSSKARSRVGGRRYGSDRYPKSQFGEGHADRFLCWSCRAVRGSASMPGAGERSNSVGVGQGLGARPSARARGLPRNIGWRVERLFSFVGAHRGRGCALRGPSLRGRAPPFFLERHGAGTLDYRLGFTLPEVRLGYCRMPAACAGRRRS